MDTNQLYYGDNLEILRNHIPDESVDLIYIDPPFNSNQAYNVIFSESDGSSSQAQIQAFEDTWHWGDTTEEVYHDLIGTAPHQLVETIKSFRGFLTQTNLMAYLVMMAVRLVELHRVLKPTGSFYLHCDPTASHYLKIILDQIFGVENFRNEVTWKRFNFHADAKRYGCISDRLLFYTRSSNFSWNQPRMPFSDGYVNSKFTHEDEQGVFRLDNLNPPGGRGPIYEFRGIIRPWRYTEEKMKELDSRGRIYCARPGDVPQLKRYLAELDGQAVPDLWQDIPPINPMAKERLGYPTQKPEALLERIIKASSNKGDTVLDAFCGCGTAISVAQRLNRQWIGIDITHLAIALLKYRLTDTFGEDVKYEIIGEPRDEAGARALANQDRYQFQWWALSLIRARPYQNKKKGADEGVDGIIYYQDVDPDNPKKALTRKIVVQVKSGKVSVKDIRELKSVVKNQEAEIGVFITLSTPTKPMLKEAATAERFQWLHVTRKTYPRIQIRTIQELLEGQGIEYPQTPVDITFRKAKRATSPTSQLEIEGQS